MNYQTQTVIQMTPEQLGQLFDDRLSKALASYVPPAHPAAELPEYPTRKQVKKFLQTSYTTLNVWAKDTAERNAVLIPVKVNGRVRYRRDDVVAVLKEHRRFKKESTK